MFIILQIFFATSGICQSIICQHDKVCQLASKIASFNIHFQNFEQTSRLLPKKILKGPSEINAENLGAQHMK